MQAPAFEPAQWPRISALLDEWLELDAPARQHALEALRTQDPALADQLALVLAAQTAGEALDRALPARPAPPADLTGQRFGPYTLLHELGRGGMGSVWLARRSDGAYDAEVALKLLQPGLLTGAEHERFAREGRILAQLTHPHIARLLDAGLGSGGQPYLVLELVEGGQAIDRHCDSHGLDLTARIRLFLDVLAAVAHAHSRLVLHRDLKPGNILVNAQGEVKLLDFGIAKLLQEASADGEANALTQRAGRAYTLHYAAPEQLQGTEVSTATDVHALGVLLYQLLVGRHPLLQGGEAPLDTMRQIVDATPPRMSQALQQSAPASASDPAPPPRHRWARQLRGDLDTIVAKALKKAPAERYQNAAELAEDLRHWLAHEPIRARPDRWPYRSRRFLRRHWLGVSATGLVVLSLAVGLGLAASKTVALERQRAQAEGLLEFMIGDLRKRLQPVGRLDALDAVAERALRYYADQQADALDADALGRRARALHLMGEIAEQRGQLARAEALFQQAADSTAALLARDPQVSQRLFDHAQSVYWVGNAAWQRGHSADAERAFGQYRTLADALVRLEPQRLDWQAEQAYAQQNLGVVWLDQLRLDEALRALQATVQTWQTLQRQRPADGLELARAQGWLAAVHDERGEFTQALQVLQAKLATLAALPSADNSREVQQLRARTEQERARLLLALGRAQASLDAAAASLADWDALGSLDPTNQDWQAEAALARLARVHALAALARPGAARAELAALAPGLRPLLTHSDSPLQWQVLLQGRWLSALARWWPDAPAVDAQMDQVLARLDLFGAPDRPLPPDQLRSAAELAVLRGDRLWRQGRRDDARHLWQATAARLYALASLGEPRAQLWRAHAALRLGQAQEARETADKLSATAFRHPVLLELQQGLSRSEQP